MTWLLFVCELLACMPSRRRKIGVSAGRFGPLQSCASHSGPDLQYLGNFSLRHLTACALRQCRGIWGPRNFTEHAISSRGCLAWAQRHQL